MIFRVWFDRQILGEIDRVVSNVRRLSGDKAKSPGAHSRICLPLADTERLSGDFVAAKYDIATSIINFLSQVFARKGSGTAIGFCPIAIARPACG